MTRFELSRDKGVKLLTVEEAVKKSTTIAAQMMGVWDRGLIRPGFWADITVFDLENITDKGTYQMPHQYPEGIRYVLINGLAVVDEGKHNCARPGKFLRGPRYKGKKTVIIIPLLYIMPKPLLFLRAQQKYRKAKSWYIKGLIFFLA